MKLRRLPDYTGQRFGRLLVAGRSSQLGSRHVLYACRCDCGNPATVQSTHLASGATQSCGCLNSEASAARKLRHGDARKRRITPEYRAWQKMRARCEDPKDPRYHRYGERGIRVCARWRGSFAAFLEDMGRRPSSAHSLERERIDGNYEPGNCCWATDTEQQRNTSRTRRVRVGDEDLPVAEWSERTGRSPSLIATRLRRGWQPAAAVETAPLETWDRRKGRRHG